MSADVAGVKQGQRMMWAQGDYPTMSKPIAPVGELLVELVGAEPGEKLLDVATGTGNVAIPAALRGITVTGLDITPELLQIASARASEEGVELTLIEGDAEELPFEDASFDRVTSSFGVMFAPRHHRAAAELVRVTRPGARIAISAWTPAGLNGKMFATMGSYLPAPPPGAEPSVMWGLEDHVRELFADSGARLSFERRTVSFTAETIEEWVSNGERTLGPLVVAKALLEPQGTYEQLRAELIGLYSQANEAENGTFAAQAEYLVTLADLPA